MEICEPPIFGIAEEPLLFSLPASRANPQALPGSDEARAMTVGSGQRLLPLASSDQAVFREQGKLPIAEDVLTVLTDRERQIMRLVSEGLSNKEIAHRLNIADGTIKVHLHHIFQKLEISNRTVLAALAISQGDRSDFP